MYSANLLRSDGMCVICTEVEFGAECTESIQCNFSRQAECVNVCRCKTNFDYNGQLCVGNIRTYRAYISNIIYNAVFSAKMIIIHAFLI
jgi:hypothetical protein